MEITREVEKDQFPYYLAQLQDVPGLIRRDTTMKQRVSDQMRAHINRMNTSAGFDSAPILQSRNIDFAALA